jgi:hypothetical protein
MGMPVEYDFKTDPILKPAYDYWRSKRIGGAIPRRVDIDPAEIRPLLPNIQITELMDDGKRIRFRLAGSAIIDAYGSELRGKYLDEVMTGERLRFAEENYLVMCERKRPVFVVNRYHSARNVELVCYRLAMPLSDDGEIVSQCLTAMNFKFPSETGGPQRHWTENNADFDVATSYFTAVEIDQDA